MFKLRALTLLVAVIATSALPQHTNEQSEAGITGTSFLSLTHTDPLPAYLPPSDVADPNAECTAYYYAPSGQYIANFPPIWQPATLLANDTAGQALWANISGSIPNIAPKGQINGSTINETYNAAADPDCCELRPFCHVPMRG